MVLGKDCLYIVTLVYGTKESLGTPGSSIAGSNYVCCLGDVDQIVVYFEEHGQSLDSSAILEWLPAEFADHCRDASRSPVCIVVECEAGCATLDLVKAVDIV